MEEISLYIHIPFCKQKCLYCDFPSYGGKDNLIEDYVDALCKELKEKGRGYKIRSIFIGGGTPSHLPEIQLEKLLKVIKTLDFHENIEYSVECNPGSITKEKLNIMKDNYVNRISMGLQSTDNSLLKGIGRIHSFEVFKENYNLAREVGFKNINIDLMFALPNQSLKQWKKTLNDIVDLKPEHISAYSLIVEEGTPFYSLYEKKLLNLPTEDEEREMSEMTLEILKRNGYQQYEISNYALKEKECYHNKIYWKCKNYLGVGVSASSYINGIRLKNIDSIEDYIQNVKKGEGVIEEKIVNSIEDNMEEFMFMGLRMIKGVSEKDFLKRFNKSIDEVYGRIIEKNIKIGLIKRENERIFLTAKGIEVSNAVMSEFIL